MPRASRPAPRRQYLFKQWQRLLKKVLIFVNNFLCQLLMRSACHFYLDLYRRMPMVLGIADNTTIAKRRVMVDTATGTRTTTAENSADYTRKPEECKHKNPRRWGGKSGTFLICDHCGTCWQRTSAEEPETWVETGARKKPGDAIPKLGRPKAKGRTRRQCEAPGGAPTPSAAPSSRKEKPRPTRAQPKSRPPTPPPPPSRGDSSASSSPRQPSWQEYAAEEFELTDLEDFAMATEDGEEL